MTAKFLLVGCAFVGADLGGMAAYVARVLQESHFSALGFAVTRDDVWVHVVLGHGAAFLAFQPLWAVVFESGGSGCISGFFLSLMFLPGFDGQHRLICALVGITMLCVPLAMVMGGPPRALSVDLDHRIISGGNFGGPLAIGNIRALGSRCQSPWHIQNDYGSTTCYVFAYVSLNRVDLLAIGGRLNFSDHQQADDIADGIRNFINSGGTTLQ